MNLRRKWNSLKVRVIVVVLFTCVPVLLLLFWMNYYSIALIEQRIYENDYDILSLNMNLLDGELNRVSNWLVSEALYRTDKEEFASADSGVSEPAAQRYKNLIAEQRLLFHYMEGIGCYSAKNGKQVYGFSEYSDSFVSRMEVLEYAKEHVDELSRVRGRWVTCSVGEKAVLLCAAGDEEVLFYAWTTFETLSVPVEDWKLEKGVSCVMTSPEGVLRSRVDDPALLSLDYGGSLEGYYYTGDSDAYLMTGVESSVGDFRMMAVVDRSQLLGTFYVIRAVVIAALAVFAGALFPWLLRSLHKSVFLPIGRMEEAFAQVEQGNLEVRIESSRSSNELAHLIDSFHDMVAQIRTLKIQVYEDALEKKQLEMDYLQLQLEPHFFLNALNLVSLMAQAGDTQLIPRLTENLSAYLRYIAGTRGGKTTLKEEIDHVGHYLKIMEIRVGDNFHYTCKVEEGLDGVVIPPLMLQLLVENSMKYAFDIAGESVISLTAVREEDEIVFTVQDNGKGYPDEILERFEHDIPPEDKHIGLWNLKQRLRYLYGERAVFSISNASPQGARTRIRIPAEKTAEAASAGSDEGGSATSGGATDIGWQEGRSR